MIFSHNASCTNTAAMGNQTNSAIFMRGRSQICLGSSGKLGYELLVIGLHKVSSELPRFRFHVYLPHDKQWVKR
ncbi:MAG: hypothetical protein KDE51_07435, partial [Anaerolineales bacterium]|nr:hypothetical protein [Anaerolineales bacterium]